MKATINCDGGARGNPGPAGIGVVVRAGGEVHEIAEFIGNATNNVAEYTALIRGLEKAMELGADEASVLMDSELIVMQLKGRYKVKNEGLQPLYARVRELIASLVKFKVAHIPREENTEADRLSKIGSSGRTEYRSSKAAQEESQGAPGRKMPVQGSLF